MKTPMSFALVLALLTCGAFIPTVAQTQSDLDEAADRDAAKADREMNLTYKGLMKKIDDEAKVKLKASQQAWIKFREADCRLAEDRYRGGSIQPMIFAQHYAEITRQRTGQLQQHFKDFTDP